jgi:hypothetical protein
VRIDLFDDLPVGAYAVSVQAAPAGLAAPSDIPTGSASVTLDGGPAPVPATMTLAFRPAVASPVGLDPLRRDPALLYAFLYHPVDTAAILAFDARITGEYTAFYGGRGVHYCGTFHVDGSPLGACIGEIITFDTTDRSVAERLCSDDISERIAAIEDECRTLQGRERARYVIWLQRSGS